MLPWHYKKRNENRVYASDRSTTKGTSNIKGRTCSSKTGNKRLTKDVNEVKNHKWSTLSIDDVRKVMNEEKKSWWSKIFKK